MYRYLENNIKKSTYFQSGYGIASGLGKTYIYLGVV